ncbi:MAG TPA: family 65 glycosyl hydrolase [Clostridiaceae bacterium]|nr:family 65 glycosyl hydrolase [Clostridiaceae bacterium]
MNQYLEIDEWNIVENGFHPENNRFYESIMSLGNGHMGIRGNFEENYSGDTLKGTYIAGVYYPDKTRVGWWKVGYPEYFAKVINAPNFIGIGVLINGEDLDLAKAKVIDFKRILNMKHGFLLRKFTISDFMNKKYKIEVKRFLSAVDFETAAISYSITPLDCNSKITFIPYIDGDVSNEDSNYNEKFWEEQDRDVSYGSGYLTMKTKKLDFYVSSAMAYSMILDNSPIDGKTDIITKEKYIANRIGADVKSGSTITLYKYIAAASSRYHAVSTLSDTALKMASKAREKGFNTLFDEHSRTWEDRWTESDISIEGDAAALQGIRFNIFELNQTYTGDDPELNIGPKGYTGEKYGGSTYWDTEAFCLPFYLSTREKSIARNLLMYRYNQLGKAKENARKLGLSGALYPMVTMNGEECHNEWEITFEEVHRNAAISYAIFNYVRYTGDEEYIVDYGFEVLVETSRFWASRVTYNPSKGKYMILGVTGPNEYENNVNNNWYTNTMAAWNIEYTLRVSDILKGKYPEKYLMLVKKLGLSDEEMKKWKHIYLNMYYPYVKELEIFEQQDGYMDKEQRLASDIPPEDLPINQHWSWDRILRSCFLKQADVIMGLFLLGDRFDMETKKRNFDFYEPRTVHESSLSACIYSIMAAEIGYEKKAYKLYLRTARLDLDNYNNDTQDGLHITSMAGTWMAIVYGFGGMRIKNNTLCLNPFAPEGWKSYSFKILFREHLLKITVDQHKVTVKQEKGSPFNINMFDKVYAMPQHGILTVNVKKNNII